MNNSAKLPVLSSFEKAMDRYVETTPYKNGSRSQGKRPLGDNRRYDTCLIRRDNDKDGTSTVVCTLYNTDVVTYRADGSIVLRHDKYETISTMDFINSLLKLRMQDKETLVPITHPVILVKGKLYVMDENQKAHRFIDCITITANNEVVGGAEESKYVLNQERMAEVRKYYADFIEYCKYYAQITGREVLKYQGEAPAPKLATLQSDLRWHRNGLYERLYEKTRANFFDTLEGALTYPKDDPKRLELFNKLARQLYLNASKDEWVNDRRTYISVCTFEDMKQKFYELCRLEYSSFVYSLQQVPVGTVVRDDNMMYVQYGAERTL